jgi:hypothetical protein
MSNFNYPPERQEIDVIIERLNLLEDASTSDLFLMINPSTVNIPATSDAHYRDIDITLVNGAGNVHSWFTAVLVNKASIADTSALGTASITTTTMTFTAGVCRIRVFMDAQDWLATETNTLTIANLTINGYTVVGKTSIASYI